MRDPIEHEINLRLATGADLKILWFSDRETRWLFSYDYRGFSGDYRDEKKRPGDPPDVVNDVQLMAEYVEGILANSLVLSMHVVVPSKLGREFYAGVDISSGAKTYLEFTYRLYRDSPDKRVYLLVEICKGARERVVLDEKAPALVRPIAFPFPIPDRVVVEYGKVRVPFLANDGVVQYFELPWSTVR